MKKTISLVLVLALGLTAGVANADFTFDTPTNLGPTVNSFSGDFGPSISADRLTLYFSSKRPGGFGGDDIWVTTRPTTDAEWGPPMNLGSTVNSSKGDSSSDVSADGLMLYFTSDRTGGYGLGDLWVTTRAKTSDPWSTPVNLGSTVNSSAADFSPSISADGLMLYFVSGRSGGYGSYDLWVTMRATTNDDWSTPVNLGPPVNSSSREVNPSISSDGLMLFFSNRTGGYGGSDLWVTTRATVTDPWGTPMNLGPIVNSSSSENSPSISADGSTLYFMSNRPGGYGGHDLWQVSILPVVDFNGDGIVDSADICLMVDYWGTDEPLYDIGPMPWGDGIVDVQDLIVLAEHLFEEIFPVELVAYWKLDETEGSITYDSIGDNDGILNGGPLWQPAGGQIDGALAFDGTDDYVSTPFVLNPATGAFSVFAWIKGGAPGQVIISQTDIPHGVSVNWLCADPSEGKLMTEFKSPSRAARGLLSQTVITDGNWHRVGFVWDGSNLTLYVDDVEEAAHTQGTLAYSTAGLHIGAGSTLEPGSFFSGLIDDVRVYDRAIMP